MEEGGVKMDTIQFKSYIHELFGSLLNDFEEDDEYGYHLFHRITIYG